MVEKLMIPLLDACSISQLAQVHQLTVEALQGASFWIDLVKRTVPYDENCPEEHEHNFCDLVQDMFEEQLRRGMRHLISLLRKMEDPHVCLLQLLHVICERFPSVGVRDWNGKPIVFQVSCPCKTSHYVSYLGFLHLEEVEGVLGSSQWEL